VISLSYELNDKIKNLVPYEPITGTYKIRLDANECTENYPEELMKRVLEAVSQVNFNRYPDPNCIELRKAFAEFYDIDYKNVTVGNGSDELIFVLQSAFLKKGEKILVATPDFSMYEFYSSICECGCIKFTKNFDLNIDVDSLIETINENNIGMVLFSNPCNPTGQGMIKSDAMKLISSVNNLVILDEAYMDFWGEENSLMQDVNKYDNLVVFRTASKAIGSAGLRLGFAVANNTISRAIAAVKSPYNVNNISQAIGTAVYNHKDLLKNRIKSIVENTNWLYNELVNIGNKIDDFNVYPTKTNFVFVKTSFGKDLWEYLKDNSVVIRYMGDYIRITCGTSEENSELLMLIKKYLEERC